MFHKKKLLSLTLLLIFALCAPAAFAGTAYYCDLSNPGTDSGSAGTFEDPFVSLKECNNTSFSTGDDLYFKAGEDTGAMTSDAGCERLVVDWSGTSGDRVIIGGYWDDGGSPNTDMTGKTKPILRGTRNGGRGTSGNWPGAYVAMILVKGDDYVTIQDIQLSDVGGVGIQISNSVGATISRCVVTNVVEQGILVAYSDGGVTDFIIEENDIKLKRLDKKVTYHDPCHTPDTPQKH